MPDVNFLKCKVMGSFALENNGSLVLSNAMNFTKQATNVLIKSKRYGGVSLGYRPGTVSGSIFNVFIIHRTK